MAEASLAVAQDGKDQFTAQPPDLTVSQRARAALDHYKQKDNTKVVVRFKSIGAAPIMKNNVFKITGSNKFQAVIVFLRGQLGLKEGDPLFTYINGAFAPTPDDPVMNLYKCFGTEGHLIVNYRYIISIEPS